MDDERMPLGLRGASVRSAQSSGGTQQGSLNGLSRDRRRSSSYGRVGRSRHLCTGRTLMRAKPAWQLHNAVGSHTCRPHASLP